MTYFPLTCPALIGALESSCLGVVRFGMQGIVAALAGRKSASAGSLSIFDPGRNRRPLGHCAAAPLIMEVSLGGSHRQCSPAAVQRSPKMPSLVTRHMATDEHCAELVQAQLLDLRSTPVSAISIASAGTLVGWSSNLIALSPVTPQFDNGCSSRSRGGAHLAPCMVLS